mmetsp:Transcript_4675/g.14139  ORF Transcript_4675/g.14139 Transcript_4675/m.14139 type:complete len:226 (-) Transcript_4675:211-888(-)
MDGPRGRQPVSRHRDVVAPHVVGRGHVRRHGPIVRHDLGALRARALRPRAGGAGAAARHLPPQPLGPVPLEPRRVGHRRARAEPGPRDARQGGVDVARPDHLPDTRARLRRLPCHGRVVFSPKEATLFSLLVAALRVFDKAPRRVSSGLWTRRVCRRKRPPGGCRRKRPPSACRTPLPAPKPLPCSHRSVFEALRFSNGQFPDETPWPPQGRCASRSARARAKSQ